MSQFDKTNPEKFKRDKKFLICVDSDGCLLDNMELKHKECFCPATVNIWDLQSVSKYARESAEYVNLYSRTRGMNRFPALIRTLELLSRHKEAIRRGYKLPDLEPLKKWIRETPVLGAAALEEYYNSHEKLDPVLERAAVWSREVDSNIRHIVRNIAPFPGVLTVLEKASEFANVVVVSSTPSEALNRELKAVGIDRLVDLILGQDVGTKENCIKIAKGDCYRDENVLKIGDAYTDYLASEANGALFYPIIPGEEDNSWKELYEDILESFRNGDYKEKLMADYKNRFLGALPEGDPW